MRPHDEHTQSQDKSRLVGGGDWRRARTTIAIEGHARTHSPRLFGAQLTGDGDDHDGGFAFVTVGGCRLAAAAQRGQPERRAREIVTQIIRHLLHTHERPRVCAVAFCSANLTHTRAHAQLSTRLRFSIGSPTVRAKQKRPGRPAPHLGPTRVARRRRCGCNSIKRTAQHGHGCSRVRRGDCRHVITYRSCLSHKRRTCVYVCVPVTACIQHRNRPEQFNHSIISAQRKAIIHTGYGGDDGGHGGDDVDPMHSSHREIDRFAAAAAAATADRSV